MHAIGCGVTVVNATLFKFGYLWWEYKKKEWWEYIAPGRGMHMACDTFIIGWDRTHHVVT